MRSYSRRGPWRNLGASPGFNEVRNYFDFPAVKIGAWVSKDEQRLRARDFFIALLDLQEILAVPAWVISLRGQLSLHYGTGGQPGVAAHYQPAGRVLALAKNAGAGSLAHEWFHAFDHYIAGHIFSESVGSKFASTAWLVDAPLKMDPLCLALADCFRTILLDDSGQEPSEYLRRSIAHDETMGTLYWSKPEELCARAFEAYIEDAAITNEFLVHGSQLSSESFDPYPQGEHRTRINDAFALYFASLGQRLQAVR